MLNYIQNYPVQCKFKKYLYSGHYMYICICVSVCVHVVPAMYKTTLKLKKIISLFWTLHVRMQEYMCVYIINKSV